ncbi:MAG: ABC transporter substrate-binding protein [Candidatus Thorarchaeota archaeon]|jgi:ABC-type transport system substrate-binding protein
MSDRVIARVAYAATIIVLVSSFLVVQNPVSAHCIDLESDWSKKGPYVDKLLIRYQDHDTSVQALVDGEVDIIADSLDSETVDELTESENIEIAQSLRNGYGYMTINTGKYPLNETALRRAIAFALDKEAISREVWSNQAEPLDSPIPKCNPFSIDGTLGYSYYSADSEEGNRLLDEAGFLVDSSTGFRTAPDGSAFHIDVETAESSDIAIDVGEFTQEALRSIYINGTHYATDFYEYLNRLYFHGDYDMVFLGSTFSDFDVDWLATEFWSFNADTHYCNFPGWKNATYDSWRDQLLHSTDHDLVYQASAQMQEIWIYECPMIICYETLESYAYRTDVYERIVTDSVDGVASWWTPYNAYLMAEKGGPFGGTLRMSHSGHARFNPFQSCSCYGSFVDDIPWETLLRRSPEGNILPWLAESYQVETSFDDSSVPLDTTRITFNILQNATWSDNNPLTAEDVAFSFNFHMTSKGNPFGSTLDKMTACYSPSPRKVVVEFQTISYWHIPKFTSLIIVPKHIFGAPGFNLTLWNPDPNNGPIVTSGPFHYTSYESGDYLELTFNPNYFYGLYRGMTPCFATNSTGQLSLLEFTGLTITVGSLVVVVAVVVLWKKEV